MKFKKLILFLMLLILVVFPQSVLAGSFTTSNYTTAVVYSAGGVPVPFTINHQEFLLINGYSGGGVLTVQTYEIAGLIKNYQGYPFSMYQSHQYGDLYEGSTFKKSINQGDLTSFDFLYSPQDRPWNAYGRTDYVWQNMSASAVNKAKVHSWFHTGETLPADSYKNITHTFWNGGWVN